LEAAGVETQVLLPLLLPLAAAAGHCLTKTTFQLLPALQLPSLSVKVDGHGLNITRQGLVVTVQIALLAQIV
jgi:hypothetical protein